MLGNWHQLWEIVSAPDNVPIVALLFLIPFYIWYAFRQAFANDELIAKLEADPAAAKTAHRKTQPYQPQMGARSPHLALPDAHRIRGRHSGHSAADGLVPHAERATRVNRRTRNVMP